MCVLTHVYTAAHGTSKAPTVKLAPAMHTLTHVCEHTDTGTLKLPVLTAGGGAGALQTKRHGSSARPMGLASDARGYFKPGSMDEFW